jgi:hypothetical protein
LKNNRYWNIILQLPPLKKNEGISPNMSQKKGRTICINEPESFSFFFFLFLENEINFSSSAYTKSQRKEKKANSENWCFCTSLRMALFPRFTSFYFLYFHSCSVQFCVSKYATIFLSELRDIVYVALRMTQWNIIKYVRTFSREREQPYTVQRRRAESSIWRYFLICDINFICQEMTTKLKNRNLFSRSGVCVCSVWYIKRPKW